MLRPVIWVVALGYCAAVMCAQPQEKAPAKEPAKELVEYVQAARKSGLKDAQIEQNAVKAGWPEASVKEALDSVQQQEKTTTAQFDASQGKQAPETLAADPKAADSKPEAAAANTPPANSAPAVELKPEPAKPAENSPEPPSGGNPAKGPAGTPPPAAASGNAQNTYRIGEGDVLQISVWGEPSASVGSGVVRPDGMISMPLIKDVHIAGMTTAEAEKMITQKLSNLIKAADVTVIVSQINSKKIFIVGGGVKKEGPIAYTYQMTIMQALSEAGGLTDYAKRKKIYVLRNEDGRQFKLPFDYDAVLNGEHMELNIPLVPGDTLVVPNH